MTQWAEKVTGGGGRSSGGETGPSQPGGNGGLSPSGPESALSHAYYFEPEPECFPPCPPSKNSVMWRALQGDQGAVLSRLSSTGAIRWCPPRRPNRPWQLLESSWGMLNTCPEGDTQAGWLAFGGHSGHANAWLMCASTHRARARP